jgi:hypothetical protein
MQNSLHFDRLGLDSIDTHTIEEYEQPQDEDGGWQPPFSGHFFEEIGFEHFDPSDEGFGDFTSSTCNHELQQTEDFDDLWSDFDNNDNGYHDPPDMVESRRKLASHGFSWNKAKMVRMLSSKSLRNNLKQERKEEPWYSSDELSVINSVDGSCTTGTTEYSDFSNISAVAARLSQLPPSELAKRFIHMQQKLAQRKQKLMLSRSDRMGVGKRGSLFGENEKTTCSDERDEECEFGVIHKRASQSEMKRSKHKDDASKRKSKKGNKKGREKADDKLATYDQMEPLI